MGRQEKLRKGRGKTKRPPTRKPPKNDDSRVPDLERRLAEALEQQAATAEILHVISRSPTDLQPVFDSIIAAAVRLLRAKAGMLTRIVGDEIHPAATVNQGGAEDPAVRAAFPRSVRAAGNHAQAIRERAPVNMADAQTDPAQSEERRAVARARGYRSLTIVPLLRHGEALGTIAVSRREAGGFTAHEVALLKTFADQAVIAIENVRLVEELRASKRELTEALDQQIATSEILRVISNSPTNLQAVFDSIVESVVRLCDGVSGFVYRFDGELIHLSAHHHTVTSKARGVFERRYPAPPSRASMIAQAILDRAVVHVRDFERDTDVAQASRDMARAANHRSTLAVPMLRHGSPIGAIAVGRRGPHGEARPFSESEIELLKTFADQAVIAIDNGRLFNELEASNREIAEKSRQIEAASRHKSEFLANMSHELRTPLNAIIGYSELLEEEAGEVDGGRLVPDLQKIATAAKHQLSLINDVLDLSKVEAGRMELELSDFDVPTALDSALTLVRERAGRRGIALQMRADGRVGHVRADERKVRQVVLNLLSNAIKFTPEGGRIAVTAARQDRSVEVSVSDTGIGIAPEDQEKVFEEFRQVGTAEQKVEGTGLGLALARRFVELHGGRIWVTSRLGEGATFTFALPAGGG